jgi:hypothetical protein
VNGNCIIAFFYRLPRGGEPLFSRLSLHVTTRNPEQPEGREVIVTAAASTFIRRAVETIGHRTRVADHPPRLACAEEAS